MQTKFFMGFIVILCLLSSNFDKVKSMYIIPYFHPHAVYN
jgi:hypothetical protein